MFETVKSQLKKLFTRSSQPSTPTSEISNYKNGNESQKIESDIVKLELLPLEILLEVISYLPLQGVARLQELNKYFNYIINEVTASNIYIYDDPREIDKKLAKLKSLQEIALEENVYHILKLQNVANDNNRKHVSKSDFKIESTEYKPSKGTYGDILVGLKNTMKVININKINNKMDTLLDRMVTKEASKHLSNKRSRLYCGSVVSAIFTPILGACATGLSTIGCVSTYDSKYNETVTKIDYLGYPYNETVTRYVNSHTDCSQNSAFYITLGSSIALTLLSFGLILYVRTADYFDRNELIRCDRVKTDIEKNSNMKFAKSNLFLMHSKNPGKKIFLENVYELFP